jgi:hypothetical protein
MVNSLIIIDTRFCYDERPPARLGIHHCLHSKIDIVNVEI